jgi:hypothetical protein
LEKNLEKGAHNALGQKRQNAHASLAMKTLRHALAKGFADVQLLRTDHDLDALRSRDDFKKLLVELEKKPPQPSSK